MLTTHSPDHPARLPLPSRGSHSPALITLDLVLDTSHAKPVFVGEVAVDARRLVMELCWQRQWVLHAVATAPAYIHVQLTVPLLVGGDTLAEVLKSRLRKELSRSFPEVARLRSLFRWDILVTSKGRLHLDDLEAYLARPPRRALSRRRAL